MSIQLFWNHGGRNKQTRKPPWTFNSALPYHIYFLKDTYFTEKKKIWLIHNGVIKLFSSFKSNSKCVNSQWGYKAVLVLLSQTPSV